MSQNIISSNDNGITEIPTQVITMITCQDRLYPDVEAKKGQLSLDFVINHIAARDEDPSTRAGAQGERGPTQA